MALEAGSPQTSSQEGSKAQRGDLGCLRPHSKETTVPALGPWGSAPSCRGYRAAPVAPAHGSAPHGPVPPLTVAMPGGHGDPRPTAGSGCLVCRVGSLPLPQGNPERDMPGRAQGQACRLPLLFCLQNGAQSEHLPDGRAGAFSPEQQDTQAMASGKLCARAGSPGSGSPQVMVTPGSVSCPGQSPPRLRSRPLEVTCSKKVCTAQPSLPEAVPTQEPPVTWVSSGPF